jgi:two-component system KDP operon response regulator KdpE
MGNLMGDKILIVDDDPISIELIEQGLQSEDYQTLSAKDGQEAMRVFFNNQPDLVVLDVTMPKLDGYEVCRRVREISDTPIIMLTAMTGEEAIIKGLDMGADDYLTKPFRVGELLARIRATLRRVRTDPDPVDTITYSDDHMSIDLDARRVTVKGEIIKLTPTEYKLLAMLIRNKGRLLEFRQLLEGVWGFEYIDDIDYLRVYIWYLRRKLEPNPQKPIYILNELNTGYRFEPQN